MTTALKVIALRSIEFLVNYIFVGAYLKNNLSLYSARYGVSNKKGNNMCFGVVFHVLLWPLTRVITMFPIIKKQHTKDKFYGGNHRDVAFSLARCLDTQWARVPTPSTA